MGPGGLPSEELRQEGLQGQEQERPERRQRTAQCDPLLTLGELSGCCLWGDQREGQVYSRRAWPWKRQPRGLEVAHEGSGTLIVGATPGSLAGWGVRWEIWEGSLEEVALS